jgi:hypothetical protein
VGRAWGVTAQGLCHGETNDTDSSTCCHCPNAWSDHALEFATLGLAGAGSSARARAHGQAMHPRSRLFGLRAGWAARAAATFDPALGVQATPGGPRTSPSAVGGQQGRARGRGEAVELRVRAVFEAVWSHGVVPGQSHGSRLLESFAHARIRAAAARARFRQNPVAAPFPRGRPHGFRGHSPVAGKYRVLPIPKSDLWSFNGGAELMTQLKTSSRLVQPRGRETRWSTRAA